MTYLVTSQLFSDDVINNLRKQYFQYWYLKTSICYQNITFRLSWQRDLVICFCICLVRKLYQPTRINRFKIIRSTTDFTKRKVNNETPRVRTRAASSPQIISCFQFPLIEQQIGVSLGAAALLNWLHNDQSICACRSVTAELVLFSTVGLVKWFWLLASR